jgi:CRISPR type I-E-associated protein CasB/Cse2
MTAIPSQASRTFAAGLRRIERSGDRATLAEIRRFADGRPRSLVGLATVASLGAPLEDDGGLAAYELVAGLFAFYHRGTVTEAAASGDLGWSFGSLAAKDPEAEGPRRRFQTLLESRWDGLDDQLRRAISLLRAKGVPVDWAALLDGVLGWDRPDRRTQDAWATSFVRATTKHLKEEVA